MIIGIGHDIVQIDRIAAILDGKMGNRFQERTYTSSEREMARGFFGTRLHQFMAGRFAAKEAVAKAFGTGLGSVLSFVDIEISRDEQGKPRCVLSEKAWQRLGMASERISIHITITHEHHLASAFAVVEQLDR